MGFICDPRDKSCTTLYLHVIGMIHAKYFCFDLATGTEEDDF